MRERLEGAEAAGVGSQRDCEALRHALSSVEAKLAEYQHKDAEVSVGKRMCRCFCV